MELATLLGVPISFIYDRTRQNAVDPIPHFKLGKYANRLAYIPVHEAQRSGSSCSDQAISGAVIDERTSIQRLLTVAEEERPRPFDVLLIDDTSRLARNVEDQLFTIKRLGFHGVHVVSVSQGLDSSSASARMTFTLHGMMDEQFLEDLANKVRRGQEGCVLKGKYIAGGRCYGYRNVPDEDPTQKGDYGRALVRGVQRQPIEEEATIVRRIFQMYADGLSFDRIAQMLRAE